MSDTFAKLRRNSRRLRIDGELFLVFEILAPVDRASTPSLVFESVESVRIVREYPATWRDLDNSALVALSRSR